MRMILILGILSSCCYSACLWPLEKYHYSASVYGLKAGYNDSYWAPVGLHRYKFSSLTKIKFLGKRYRVEYLAHFTIRKGRFKQLFSQTRSGGLVKSGGIRHRYKLNMFGSTAIVSYIRYCLLTGVPPSSKKLFYFRDSFVPIKITLVTGGYYNSPNFGKVKIIKAIYQGKDGDNGVVFYAVNFHYLPVYIKSRSPDYKMLPYVAKLDEVKYQKRLCIEEVVASLNRNTLKLVAVFYLLSYCISFLLFLKVEVN